MKRPYRGYGIASRQAAAQIKREMNSAPDDIRTARSAGMKLFDLRRQKADADDRVSKAREKLENVDLFGLRRELEDALQTQSKIESDIAEAEKRGPRDA
jgi:hypothetical protein